MIPKPFNEIAESDIQALLDNGVPERRTLEYKRELPSGRDEDKREFLSDVSSFANTDGGDILFGVAEEGGVPSDLAGLSNPDLDHELVRLDNLIRDGISPRISATGRTIACEPKPVVLFRIEKSWLGPHRVIFRGHDKFYARCSSGKFALDVAQLRAEFLQSFGSSERVAGFRLDRIIEIANGRTPVPLVASPERPRVVASAERPRICALHIIPLAALAGTSPTFDVTVARRDTSFHIPLGSSGSLGSRMTFLGSLVHPGMYDDGSVTSYAQFFWNGALEAATTDLLNYSVDIPHIAFEAALLEYLPRCFESLRRLGIKPPLSVMLSLVGVQGCRLKAPGQVWDLSNPIKEPNLLLPGSIVDDLSRSAQSIMRPLFDRVWNACGLDKSPNFDATGAWRP